MKRIIIHWTAGTNQPCATDYEHYHFLINGDGLVVKGKYKPEDNEVCRVSGYAAHTGGGNTGSIGISMCGMYVKDRQALKDSKYPLTKIQCERCFKLIAEMAKKYHIDINPETVMTHYEFGIKHPNTTSRGKIDITYLSPYSHLTAGEIGDFIRTKAKWYLTKI